MDGDCPPKTPYPLALASRKMPETHSRLRDPLTRTMPRSAPPGAVAMAAIVSSRSRIIAAIVSQRRLFFFPDAGLDEPLALAALAGDFADVLVSLPASFGFGLGSS